MSRVFLNMMVVVLVAATQATRAARPDDWRVVVTARATVMSGAKVAGVLPADAIVYTSAHPRDADWFTVHLGERTFEGRGADYLSLNELRARNRRDGAPLVQRLEHIRADIERTTERLLALVAGRYLLDRDSISQYREAVEATREEPVDKNRPDGPTRTVTERRYQYEDLLSSREASRLAKAWEDEVETLRRQQAALLDEQARITAKLATDPIRETHLERRLARVRELEWLPPRQFAVWVVVAPETRLFVDRQFADTLARGTVVAARPNLTYGDRLLVVGGDRLLDGKRAEFRDHLALDLEYAEGTVVFQRRVAELTLELTEVELREAVTGALLDALRLETAQLGSQVPRRQARLPAAARELPLQLRRDTDIVIDRNKARRLLRELEKENAAMVAQRDELRDRQSRLHRDQAGAENEYTTVQRRIEAFVAAAPDLGVSRVADGADTEDTTE